jgi:hypothetical protein
LLSGGRNRKNAKPWLRFDWEDAEPLDPAGETVFMIRRLMVPIAAAVVMTGAGIAFAQTPFPAPLPNQATAPAANSPFPPVNSAALPRPNDSAFPPVNGSAPSASIGAPQASFPPTGAAPFGGGGAFSAAPPTQSGASDQCMKAFMPLRAEAEKRGKMIQAAGERHAPPDEACKLIASFATAESKMISYVNANAAKCGIPPQIGEQLKASHKNTEAMRVKVCQVAEQMKTRGPAGPSLSEVLGTGSVPEANVAKKGGSTFDTLNGNVLTR